MRRLHRVRRRLCWAWTLSARPRLQPPMPATTSAFLNVTNIEKSLEFYRGLGFRVDKAYERDGLVTYADLTFDGADFGLGHIASNDDPAFRQWVSTPLGAGVVVYFTVPDVDKVYEAARRTGATIEAELEDRSYGRVFTLNDPDGYTLTFLQEPKPTRTSKRPPAKAQRGRGEARKPAAKAKAGAKRTAARRRRA